MMSDIQDQAPGGGGGSAHAFHTLEGRVNEGREPSEFILPKDCKTLQEREPKVSIYFLVPTNHDP